MEMESWGILQVHVYKMDSIHPSPPKKGSLALIRWLSTRLYNRLEAATGPRVKGCDREQKAEGFTGFCHLYPIGSVGLVYLITLHLHWESSLTEAQIASDCSCGIWTCSFETTFFSTWSAPPTLTSSIVARKLRTYLSMKAKYIMKSMEIELHEIMKSIILGFNPLLCLCMTGPSIFWLVVALVGREASRFWEHHRKHHRVVWKIPSDRWGELREHQLFRLVGARG